MTTHTQDMTGTDEGGIQRLADTAGDMAEQAGSAVENRASTTMNQVGDAVQQVARAMRDAGDSLRTEQPQVAGLTGSAADQVERVGRYLQERDANDVMATVQDFARRQPAVVIGAGFALGVLLGRAVRSTGERSGTSGTMHDRRQWSGTSRYSRADAYGGYGTDRTYGGGLRGDLNAGQDAALGEMER